MIKRDWSIRQRLFLLVAALAVPMNLLVVGSIVLLAKEQRKNEADSLQYTARAIVSAIDSNLRAYIALGQALATSPALLADDLRQFRAEAERAFPDSSRSWLVVSDAEGQQLMNLTRPPGEKLPRRAAEGIEVQRRAFATRSAQISNIVQGPVTRLWTVVVDIPIFREDRPFRVMSVAINAAVFRDLLVSQNPPASWLAGIADSRGNFVARLPRHDDNVGKPASAGWRAVMDRNSIERFRALNGEMVINANEISALSGWRVGIGVTETELARPVWVVVAFALAASALVSGLSLLLALRLSRSIARPVAELERNAAALVSGQPAELHVSLPEVARVWQSLQAAVAERTDAERRGKLLTDELAHRVKNTLAVVHSMALQTLRTGHDPQVFVPAFLGRLSSLARGHDLLTRQAWVGADLGDIASAALEPFRTGGRTAISVEGPAVAVPANAAITLTIMFYELATNAAKHGALSVPAGEVKLRWTVSDSFVDLVWSEENGPPVPPPSRQGFGSRLLQLGAQQLGATLEIDHAPAGYRYRLMVPVESFAR